MNYSECKCLINKDLAAINNGEGILGMSFSTNHSHLLSGLE